jgi:hypothetical protein
LFSSRLKLGLLPLPTLFPPFVRELLFTGVLGVVVGVLGFRE